MNRNALLMQAIRGPVVLITLGILFAIQQSGALSFSRTWPLLLIVIGVAKLLERMFTGPAVGPNAGPYAGPGAGPNGGPNSQPGGQTRPGGFSR